MMILKNTIIALAIGLLLSCNSGENTNDQTSSTNFKTKDTLISFSGYWLSKDYFESINTFKSPRKAQDNSEFIIIPDRTLKQTMMIANFHEGGPYLTLLLNNNQYELWGLYEDTLAQLVDKITILDKGNIKIGDRPFVKINSLLNDEGSLILEEILFKGIYTDDAGATIEFKNNGQVNGLNSYRIYKPIIDYFDAGMQVDQIGFGTTNNDLEYFGFTFTKDTLKLFNLKCITIDSSDNRCVEVELGQMTHKLWKKN